MAKKPKPPDPPPMQWFPPPRLRRVEVVGRGNIELVTVMQLIEAQLASIADSLAKLAAVGAAQQQLDALATKANAALDDVQRVIDDSTPESPETKP